MLHIRSKQILSVGAALWLISSPAFALDGADLMKKLTEFWTACFMAAGASLVIQQSLSGQ